MNFPHPLIVLRECVLVIRRMKCAFRIMQNRFTYLKSFVYVRWLFDIIILTVSTVFAFVLYVAGSFKKSIPETGDGLIIFYRFRSESSIMVFSSRMMEPLTFHTIFAEHSGKIKPYLYMVLNLIVYY